MSRCDHPSAPSPCCCAEPAPAGPSGTRSTVLAATIVLLLGIVAMALVITGQLNNYVQPFFRPFMAITAAALIGLGLWTLVRLSRDIAGAAGEHPVRSSSWLLLVPVLLAVLCAPDPLGASMLGSTAVGGASASMSDAHTQRAQQIVRVERNPDGTIAFPELARDEINEITLEDLANRFYFGDRDQLDGVRIRLEGFASRDPQGKWAVGRFKIYCCAADAIPYQAGVDGLNDPSPDQWYRLTATIDTAANSQLPMLRVAEATAIDQPERPYL
ncbi:hypothetical protein CCICO_04735 [Corynebacterium ciconiae DSM 44920]|uniref:TIGR03943 family putative permease subunit n=1 Tax=Corynebacterium ciconiae TaxID=227319 RepID=UPI00035E706B|nr:TIGR03943 family protein [Corynebacterium ciconiae]WKD60983.1 hypothetical protein CCICO_04735 [Corynebacterium ciconiae DSM 44920]